MKPIMMQKSFDDFDVFAEHVRCWDLDFLQLEPGPFAAEVSQYAGPRLQLMWGHLRVRLEQRGAPPVGYRTFVVPMNPEMRMHWRSHDVDGRHLLAFPIASELYSVSNADFSICTVSILEEWMEERAIALELPSPSVLLARGEVLELAPGAMNTLRAIIRTACHQLTTVALGRWGHSKLENSVATTILHILAGRADLRPKSKSRRREIGLRSALEYLGEHKRRNITVAGLARIAQVSERTLEHAFQDRFDLGPKRYLTARRMFAVRRELRCAPPGSRVQDVAKQWGFRNLGQFALDYRGWFSERPSDTIRQISITDADYSIENPQTLHGSVSGS